MRLSLFSLWSTTLCLLFTELYTRTYAQETADNSECDVGFRRILVTETVLRPEFDDFSVKVLSPLDKSYFDTARSYTADRESFRELELCVPADLCLVIEIEQSWWNTLEIGSATLLHETEGEIALKGPFYSDSRKTLLIGQVGNCDLPCNQDQTRVELDFLIERDYRGYDWRIEDSKTNEIVVECDRSDIRSLCSTVGFEMSKFWSEKVCIPKDSCYKFLAGGTFDTDQIGFGTINVTLDGERLSSLTHTNFQYLEFGGEACPKSDCAPGESLLELFVHRPLQADYEANREFPDLTWTLSTWESGDNIIFFGRQNYTTTEGTVFKNPTAQTLQYHKQCVPESFACSELTLSLNAAQLNFLSFQNIYEVGNYKLALDGVSYGESSFTLSRYDWDIDSDLKMVAHAGKQCKASEICGDFNSLLEIEFQTKEWSSDWSPRNVYWQLFNAYADDSFSNPRLLTNQIYRRMICFTADYYGCTVFGMERQATNSFKSDEQSRYYRVFVDGNELTSREYCENYNSGELCYVTGYDYVGTRVAGDCSYTYDYGGWDDVDDTSFVAGGMGIFVAVVIVTTLMVLQYRRQQDIRQGSGSGSRPSPPGGVNGASSSPNEPVAHQVFENDISGPSKTSKTANGSSNSGSSEDLDEDSHC